MALQNDTSRIQYNGNNSTTSSYAIPFVFFENAHIKCVVTSSAGVDTTLALGSTFNVTGAGNPNGGSLTTTAAVPTSSKVTIFREVPATQTTSYQEGGDFPAASHERALDKLTMIAQQTKRLADRALKVPETQNNPNDLPDSGSGAKLLTSTNGNLGWDENRNPPPYPATAGTQALVTAGSGATPSWQTIPAIATGPITATGSTTARFVSDRFADVINVKDFGAVGNGVANDAPAIRAALAYALTKESAEIVFPNGIYNLTTWSDGTGNPWTTVGQKEILPLTNLTSTYRRFLISGNGSTLTTALYPSNGLRYPQSSYSYLWNLRGNIDVVMRDLRIVSKWDGVGARGLIAEQTARTVNPFGLNIAIAVNSWDPADLANVRSYVNTPKRVLVENCTFVDWTQAISVNRCIELDVRNTYHTATWGTASCGTADPAHTACIDVFVADKVTCFGNHFIGCEKDDFAQIPTYSVAGGGSPRFRSMDNAILSQCKGMVLFSDNMVEKFCYEGILTEAFEGTIISNNIVDNKIPTGSTTSVVNQNIRVNGHEYAGQVSGSASTNYLTDLSGLLRNGDKIKFESLTGGSNLSTSAEYYIVQCDVDNPTRFKLSTTLNGSVVSLGSNISIGTIRTLNKVGGKVIISGNVVHYGGIHVYGVNDSIVSNNIIQLSSRSTTDAVNIFGIGVEARQGKNEVCNTVIENNYIFGANIPAGTGLNTANQVWDGTIGASGTNPRISCGMSLATGSLAQVKVRRNTLVLHSKDNASIPVGAFLVDAEAEFVENFVEGFDFVYGQFGGPNAKRFDIGLITKNVGRLAAEGQALGQNPVHFKSTSLKVYPTATGWYRLLNSARRSSLTKITLGVSGDSAYGSAIDNDGVNQKLQHTVFSVAGSGYDLTGTSGVSVKEFAIIQHAHTSTATPVISKVRYGAGGQQYPTWIYINSVTTRWQLAFSGGGGSGAAGYALTSNGVVQSVVVTNPGTNYTSAPTVTMAGAFAVSMDLQGAGAIFAASVSNGGVQSVSVTAGGSGYASAITIMSESDLYDQQSPSIIRAFAQDPTDNYGIELVFQQGFKSISRVGGLYDGKTTGVGPAFVMAAAPTNAPEFIGQQYINTSSGVVYLATGTANANDWQALATWNP